jgi:hypothetical protein
VTSVTLFILQPTLHDTWCTLCLPSVVISLARVPDAWDEFIASWQAIRGRLAAESSPGARLIGR